MSTRAELVRLRPLAALLSILLPACGGGGGPGSRTVGELVVERDTVGDTLVVRTLEGRAWGRDAALVPDLTIGVLDGDQDYMFGRLVSLAVGEDGTIYAVDRQIPALRVYGPDGVHVGTWGREGGGPGEFGGPDSGLGILSGDRIAVRDPGNGRIQLYSTSGEPLTSWPVVPAGFNTSNPMVVGPGDTILTPLVMNLGSDVSEWRTGLQRVGPEGEILDTLPVPDVGYQAPRLEARRENSVSINTLPFAPGEQWTWHPDGFFVHGISDAYSFTLLDPDAPLRVERVVTLPEVQPGEKAEERARATWSLRQTDPSWRWDGPAIPDRKPAFDDLFVGRDGRIWVYRQGPGVEVEDPNYDPSDPESVENRWRDTPLFDVFERDGTFLGTVEAPLDMSRYPTPVFGRDHVWAVTRDAYDVQRIVRYRIEPRADGTG